MRQSAHVLSPETEQVLSLLGTALGASQNARDLLSNAEIEWPTITLSDGTEATISNAGYGLYRQAPNREDRIAVFNFAYLPEMIPHQRAIDRSVMPEPLEKLRILEMVVERLN